MLPGVCVIARISIPAGADQALAARTALAVLAALHAAFFPALFGLLVAALLAGLAGYESWRRLPAVPGRA